MRTYKSLAYDDPRDLLFGVAKHPVTTRHGLVIGGGTVYPELNFTLPTMLVEAATMPEVRRNYQEIIKGALQRAARTVASGLVWSSSLTSWKGMRPAGRLPISWVWTTLPALSSHSSETLLAALAGKVRLGAGAQASAAVGLEKTIGWSHWMVAGPPTPEITGATVSWTVIA